MRRSKSHHSLSSKDKPKRKTSSQRSRSSKSDEEDGLIPVRKSKSKASIEDRRAQSQDLSSHASTLKRVASGKKDNHRWNPTSPDQMILEDGERGFLGHFRAASLEVWIEKATDPHNLHARCRELGLPLVLTYHAFADPKELLDLLVQRWYGPVDIDDAYRPVRERVGELIELWLFKNPADFLEDKALKQRLVNFIKAKKLEEAQGWVGVYKLLRRLKPRPVPQIIKALTEQQQMDDSPDISFLLAGDLNEVAETLADTMTEIEYELMASIQPFELLGQVWTKGTDADRAKASPHVHFQQLWADQRSRWFGMLILSSEQAPRRARMIELVAKTAEKFRDNGNFSGMLQVFTVLENAGYISRLRKSWQAVDMHTLGEEWKRELTTLFDPSKNSKNLRDAFKNAKSPFVPELSLFLKDCFMLDESETWPDYIEHKGEKLLNVEKRQQQTATYEKLMAALAKPWKSKHKHDAQLVADIRNLLLRLKPWEESRLYIVSELREPKTGETVARRGKATMSRNSVVEGTVFQGPKFELQRPAVLSDNGLFLLLHSYLLTEPDWNRILAGATIVKFEAGAELLKEDTPSQQFFRIKAGQVNVVKAGIHLVTLGESHVLGESAILGKLGRPTASVIADGDVTAWQINIDYLQRLFFAEPVLARTFFKKLSQSLANRLRELPPPGKKLVRKESVSSAASAARQAAAAKKAEDPSAKFRKKFGIASVQEALIAEFEVHVRKARSSFGARLYISSNQLNWEASVFGVRKKYHIAFRSVDSIELVVKEDEAQARMDVQDKKDKHKFLFASRQDLDQCYSLCVGILNSKRRNRGLTPVDSVALTPLEIFGAGAKGKVDETGLTDEDLKKILGGSKPVVFAENAQVMAEGKPSNAVYQISAGRLRVVKEDKETKSQIVLGELGENEVFGELSFLEGVPASASIYAATESTLNTIEGSFCQILFESDPALAARFYHFLCLQLLQRINKREKSLAK